MTERLPSAIGTVAEEAARLIEDMATMARSSPSRDPRQYAGGPAHGPVPPDAPHASPHPPPHAPPHDDDAAPPHEDDASPPADAASGVCTVCGGPSDGKPVACKLCPICQGIGLMRSVRPETVDLLADLALAVAATLRDVATRSRASHPASSARPASGSSPDGGRTDGGRTTVQDIPVDDDSEG